MDMPSSSGDKKCYRYQSIKKCKFFLHASNLVFNRKKSKKRAAYGRIYTSWSFGTCNILYPLKMTACPLKHVAVMSM
jgi:hypothetical protein